MSKLIFCILDGKKSLEGEKAMTWDANSEMKKRDSMVQDLVLCFLFVLFFVVAQHEKILVGD